MAKICLCLTGSTIDENLKTLDKYRSYIDIAELRVDCLEPDERLGIRHFPRLAGIPAILTIRRAIDGGRYSGGEGARIRTLAQGLAHAEADSRRNFAYVDIEEDLVVPSLEEAARTFGTRIIRSYHNISGIHENISEKIKSMRNTGDELVKVAVTANSTADVLNVFRASKVCAGRDFILVCMGHYGIYSRILAEQFGSFLSCTSAINEGGEPAAPGQLDARELAELYRFHKISKNTKIYGIIGNPLKASLSPWFFNTIFALEDIDAVYVPFPIDSVSSFMELAGELKIQGLSVAAPYKEAVLPWLKQDSSKINPIGACNTMSLTDSGWLGENTNIPGFSQSLLEFLGKRSLKRQKITIIGAGGAARAVAAEIHRLGGKAVILNRTQHKARAIASLYKFNWGGLDSRGIELMYKHSDVIIQTTSVGMEGSNTADLLLEYAFTGKEAVMDLIYRPEVTPFLKRAAQAGCRTRNGYDMFIRQACLQYNRFTGKDFPKKHLSRIKSGGS